MALIKKYHLQQLDNRPEGYIEPLEPVTVNKVYSVKKGDTLSLIAKKYQTTTKKLMLKNRLNTTILRIGQKLEL